MIIICAMHIKISKWIYRCQFSKVNVMQIINLTPNYRDISCFEKKQLLLFVDILIVTFAKTAVAKRLDVALSNGAHCLAGMCHFIMGQLFKCGQLFVSFNPLAVY